ncbi:glycoside hydrolase family 9 protein [Streptosporangium vulgare]|uniref:Glycoside hydrolase family 9 protein n=1 Tax=Streptosporangium vulgare TaxID=46190 RepID=A0ABV5TU75_9ACTN
MMSLPPHARTLRRLLPVAVVALLAALLPALPARAAGTVEQVAVSQAGYSSGSYKAGYVVATDKLSPWTCEVVRGGAVVLPGCVLADHGVVWGRRVYSVELTALTQPGTGYTLRVNGVSSPPFDVANDIWDGYKDEMTAFYRIQRASVATSSVYPPGYSSVAPSAKVFHGAGHLDDAASEDGTAHHDLTGGWYDAGDYGKYGGNQWVGGEIALAYLRNQGAAPVRFDNDGNGVPDLLDEARFGAEYLVKMAAVADGAMYDVRGNGTFDPPEAQTDNVSGTSDDRRISGLGVGGSAKAAGALAATARAVEGALSTGAIAAGKVADFQAFAQLCEETARTFHDYAAAHPDAPIGSYSTRGGLSNSMLFAEVELFLLTGEASYGQAATAKIGALTFDDLASTNYWDLRPLSMAEFHPVADTATKQKIKDLLTRQVEFFLSMADDTPYGVLNQFKNFGVNEPHVSYLGDMMRYYELFGDQRVLRAVLKGTYWVFGANPWNTSWVSGVGARHVKFLHTRLDAEADDQTGTGVVVPGAMVSGPNARDPQDPRSASPWYQDRPMWQDSAQQWRYNEYSISIQAGLLYTIMGLIRSNGAPSSAAQSPVRLPVTSPVIGDLVTGDVTVFAQPAAALSGADLGPEHTPMPLVNGVHTGTVNVDGVTPYTNRRVDVRGTQTNGAHTYSSTHLTVAPPPPTPQTPLLYDDFGGGGVWGSQNMAWVNWWNNQAGIGIYTKQTIDGRTAGRFFQNPASASSQAKFQPWHHSVDASGYRYLTVVMKSPSPGARMWVALNDGTKGYRVSGTAPLTVPSTWTTYDFDLNAFPLMDKSKVKMEIWLQQTADADGEVHVDDVSFTGKPEGTAPTLSGVALSPATGTATTAFTYTATYTDADNRPPFSVDLVLDGVVRRMAEVTPSDTTYTDGKAYRLKVWLPKGVHSSYVRTTDTTSPLVRTAPQTGPTVN